MASIDQVVSFNIVIQDAAPSVPNFGTIAVLAYHEVSPDRLVYDTTPAGRAAMVVDGFATSHPAYRKNAAIGAQTPKVPQIKVFNRAAPNDQVIRLTPTVVTEGKKYEFELNGVAISYTNGAEEDVEGICDGLQPLLDAVPNVTATDDTTHITLELTDPTGPRMYLKGVPRYLTVKDMSTDAGIATDLASALLEDPDFFGVLIDSESEAELNAAAAWCASNGKLFHGRSMDSDILTSATTDVCSDQKAALNANAKIWYSRDAPAELDAAIMGREFSRNPGSTTWENKQLNNVTADPLTPTEIENAAGKNCGLYLPYGGTSATFNTQSASGRFLDITRDAAWLQANAQADVFRYLLNQEKVPFTQAGIDGVEDVLRARFTIAETQGVLDEGWDITLPTLVQVDPANKAARRLVAADAFAGNFQGAIHGVDLSGVLAI